MFTLPSLDGFEERVKRLSLAALIAHLSLASSIWAAWLSSRRFYTICLTTPNFLGPLPYQQAVSNAGQHQDALVGGHVNQVRGHALFGEEKQLDGGRDICVAHMLRRDGLGVVIQRLHGEKSGG